MKWFYRISIVVIILSGLSVVSGLVYLVDYVRDENAEENNQDEDELQSLDDLYSLLKDSVKDHRKETEREVNVIRGDVARILRTILKIADRAGVDTSGLDPEPEVIVQTETDHFHHHHEGSVTHEHHHHHHHHPDQAVCDNAGTAAAEQAGGPACQ